ncbi:MAG: hypothetical protein Q8R02_08695 [Hyphomonadaceae bacterium]|nr:hypothetical protein [Hyphomonadaceae bacterium]
MSEQSKLRSRAILLSAACAVGALTALITPQAEAQKAVMSNSTPAARSKTLPPGALEVQLVEIVDSAGFGRPMTAARALVPVGWRTEGGVQWSRGTPGCADPAVFGWAAVSPDGLSRIELFPTELWQASNSLQVQCQYGEFQDIRSYLTAYLQRRHPGARVINYKPRRDFLDAQKEYLEAKIAMTNNSGLGMRAWADAGELSYSQRENGVEIEGIVSAAGIFYASSASNPLGGPPLMTLTAQTNTTFAARAPKGKLDSKVVEAIRKSVKLDPAWAQEYFKLLLQIGGVQTQGVKDRAGIIVAGGAALTASTIAANQAAANRAVKNSYADPYTSSTSSSSSSGTDDRAQRERIESIRGVETYDDPLYGGTVQLDNTYDHAWRVQTSDTYILTNDPSFNPGAYDINAQQLRLAR